MQMYSPQIRNDLVPAIYRAAKEDGIPMTVWVSGVVEEALRRRRPVTTSEDEKGETDELAVEGPMGRAS
jgi:hypothetical protein